MSLSSSAFHSPLAQFVTRSCSQTCLPMLTQRKKKKQNQATCRLHRGLTPSPKAFGDIQQNHSNLNSKNPKIQLFQRPPLFEFADIQKPQCHRLLVHYVLEPEKLDCCTPPLNAMFRQTLRSTNYFLQSLHLFC